MEVRFANETYYNKAMELAKKVPESTHSVNMAFFRLIQGASFRQLENLVQRLQREYPMHSGEEIYDYLQNPRTSPLAGTVNGANALYCAYELLEKQIPLGNETVPGRKSNTSDWMCHCLWEAKACGVLASMRGLDSAKAMKMGMLHDIGRQVTHTFDHTVRGFEILVDDGFEAEALGCLTHSFINGGRCASNEPAEPGFYVSDEGLPCWEKDSEKDQITHFLEVYSYTPYDWCLNMADLMATSRGILSPMERLRDIATRRVIDPTNRGYFLAELINLCRLWIDPSVENSFVDSAKTVRFTSKMTLEEIQEQFAQVEAEFYDAFKRK